MDQRETVMRQLFGQEMDRVPLMGGWFHGVENLAALAGLSAEAYLRDPTANLVKANKALQVDCMIDPIVPTYREEIRTGKVLDLEHADSAAEDLRRDAEAVPASEAGVGQVRTARGYAIPECGRSWRRNCRKVSSRFRFSSHNLSRTDVRLGQSRRGSLS